MPAETPTLSTTRSYTRKEISALLGGSKMSYLPFRNGRVLYAALRRDLNPHAPHQILPGFGKHIEKASEMLCNQVGRLPVFLMTGWADWKYEGDFILWRWSNKPEDLQRESSAAGREVSRIIELRRVDELPESPDVVTYVSEEFSVTEGGVAFVLHRTRERKPELVRRKKRQVLQSTGRLACEVCSFDFAAVYGSLGDGFAECHHTKPIAEYESAQQTMLNDLAVVCANCHRMLHQANGISISELRECVLNREAQHSHAPHTNIHS